jgi:hypothetical protein
LLALLTLPSIITLDNTKYHLALGTHVPKWSKMKKQEAFLFLEGKGLFFDVRMSAVELKQFVRSYIAKNKKAEIIVWQSLVDTKSFSPPPYYSDLQPIELAWAYVKGKVGQQYSIDITLQMVYNRLNKVFKELEDDHKAVLRMIDKCSKTAK